jgi:Zn-dependent protease
MIRLERVSVRGVPISLHWSVLAVCAVLWFAGSREPLALACGIASYFGMMLVHEAGHVLMARRFGYRAIGVELYPIHGITRLPHIAEPFARAVIAWGGVLAQLVVAAPLVAWLAVFGYTPYGPVNAILGVLGAVSVAIACLNLLPFRPLDGAVAWTVVPILFRALRARPDSDRRHRPRRHEKPLRRVH